jgi:hypothetical protein
MMNKTQYDYWLDWHLQDVNPWKTKYPESITINDNMFTVHLLPPDTDDVYGRTLRFAQRIYLNPQMSSSSAADTLLHETIHALYTVLNLDDKQDEETVCNVLGIWLPIVLRQNPNLLEFILNPHDKWVQKLHKNPDEDVLTDEGE